MLMNFIHFVYILSLVGWVGSIVFFSFFTAPVIFKLLDREKAGEVVGVIFPRYYFLGYWSQANTSVHYGSRMVLCRFGCES